MKDNLFEMLLSLFEKTLSQLKKEQYDNLKNKSAHDTNSEEQEQKEKKIDLIYIKNAGSKSIRIFSEDEMMKLSKGSYKFLMYLAQNGAIKSQELELILTHLLYSESSVVHLEETKWAIRNLLAQSLDHKQMLFLDFLLNSGGEEWITH